jgi:hypothetical protein
VPEPLKLSAMSSASNLSFVASFLESANKIHNEKRSANTY